MYPLSAFFAVLLFSHGYTRLFFVGLFAPYFSQEKEVIHTIFYHADTLNILEVGQCLDLYKAATPISYLYVSGSSAFGERAFIRPSNSDQSAMQIIDIMFDYVRFARFPNKPSRFTSVFASLHLEDSRRWIEEIAKGASERTGDCFARNTSGISLYEVECDTAYIADARFLDCGSALQDNQVDLAALFSSAIGYWQSVQEIMEDTAYSYSQSYQKPEILLVPPVRVLRRVDF